VITTKYPRFSPLRAFTLVELLVVLAILAVLAALLMPALQSAMERAKAGACTANIKSLAGSLLTAAADNNGFLLPRYYDKKNPDAYTFELPNGLWSDNLNALGIVSLGAQKKKTCRGNPGEPYDIKHCPGKYAYADEASLQWDSTAKQYSMVPIAKIERPSRTLLLADASVHWDWGSPRCNYYVSKGNWESDIGFDVHPGGANIAFVDGHVATVRNKNEFKVEWVDSQAIGN